MLITLTEFSVARGVKIGTLYKYLSRHDEINRTKKGKDIVIDTEDPTFGILDNAYPLPRPVQVVTGVDPEEHRQLLMAQNESLRQIAILQERITQLMQVNGQLQIENAEAKVAQLRLEDREQELRQVKDDLSRSEQAWQDEKARNDALMRRNLWQRILNRD